VAALQILVEHEKGDWQPRPGIPEQNHDDYSRDQLAKGFVGEINGVFITDKAKGVISGGKVIRETVRHIVNSGKTCVLFGYNKDRSNLGRLWNRPMMNPVCLLDGAITPPAGYATSCNVYMGYFRSDHFRRAFRLEGDDENADCMESATTTIEQ
jgi:hypothetical protein